MDQKGWPIKQLSLAEASAREAYEDAGVHGYTWPRPVGSYVYQKRLDDNAGSVWACQVRVFALRVQRQCNPWPEREQSETRWFAASGCCVKSRDHFRGARDIPVGRYRAASGHTPVLSRT